MSGERWFIVNDRNQYLAVGGASSREVLTGWVAGHLNAEPFRTMLEARDFIRWLGLTDVRPIDHHPQPLPPPDADTSKPETEFERHTRVLQEESKRLAIRKANWKIKAAGAATVLALAVLLLNPSDADARRHPHGRHFVHHRKHHHVVHRLSPHIQRHLARAPRRRPRVAVDQIAPPQRRSPLAVQGLFGSLFGGLGGAVSTAERYVGTNPTGHLSLWCADFVNFIERKLGRPGTGSRAAKSFLGYGPHVSTPRPGDIVVYARRGGGHVGYYVSGPAKRPVTVSGNAGGGKVRVGVAPLPVIAIVRPKV